MQTGRPNVLRPCFQACRKGGTGSIPGVYAGIFDGLNVGFAFGKGLTLKMGQTHVKTYLPTLLKLIEDGRIDPTFLITPKVPLSDVGQMYPIFKEKEDD